MLVVVEHPWTPWSHRKTRVFLSNWDMGLSGADIKESAFDMHSPSGCSSSMFFFLSAVIEVKSDTISLSSWTSSVDDVVWRSGPSNIAWTEFVECLGTGTFKSSSSFGGRKRKCGTRTMVLRRSHLFTRSSKSASFRTAISGVVQIPESFEPSGLGNELLLCLETLFESFLFTLTGFFWGGGLGGLEFKVT